jgi:hypothetical protein
MEAKRNLGRITTQDGNAELPSPLSITGNAEGDSDIYTGLEIESSGDDDIDGFGALCCPRGSASCSGKGKSLG